MKQAKIALTAVAILAVVGGALAFKAERGAKTTYFTNTTIGENVYCTVPNTINNFRTQVGGGVTTVLPLASTVSLTSTACTQDLILYPFQ